MPFNISDWVNVKLQRNKVKIPFWVEKQDWNGFTDVFLKKLGFEFHRITSSGGWRYTNSRVKIKSIYGFDGTHEEIIVFTLLVIGNFEAEYNISPNSNYTKYKIKNPSDLYVAMYNVGFIDEEMKKDDF